MTVFEYGYFNETKTDKEHYEKIYRNRGLKVTSFKRVKSDTKGLKMYEIELCSIVKEG